MRTRNSIYNIIIVIITYLVKVVLTFITKTVIISILGEEYNGIDGLFTSIISMLSIAELGIGTAIIYNLYEPAKNNSCEQIKSIIRFYKKCYIIIAIVVFSAGIIILPFVPAFIGELNINDDIRVIYVLFLINSVISYLFSYKQSIFIAYQKNYIINSIEIVKTILLQVSRIIIIIFTHNYFIYIVASIIFSVVQNITVYKIADYKYPYLKEKEIKPLKKETINDITTKVKGLLFHKIGSYIVLGTDNILISYFSGVVSVGLYSNYILIVNTFQQILGQMIDALIPSVGNLLLEKDYKKNYAIFKKLYFVSYWLFLVCSICFFCIVQNFIKLWIGSNHLLSISMVYCISLNFFIFGMRKPLAVFENAAGIFYENRLIPIYESVTNVVISLMAAKIFGMIGIIIGTTISSIWIFVYDFPKYVWPKVFRENKNIYVKKYILGLVEWHIICCMVYIIKLLFEKRLSDMNLFLAFLIHGFITFVICNLILVIQHHKSEELLYFSSIIKHSFMKKL